MKGGPPGDLYVFIKVKNDSKLKRDGVTIYSEINVSYLQAILGDTVEITTVDGNVDLQIPSGTQPNTCLLYTSPSPRDKRQSRMPSSA